ncbi:MAG: hypothetical protein J6V90_08430 [Treponema sp.]|nr:hypothetical protein [Treponema sp.]
MKLTISKSELARAVAAADKFSSGNPLGIDGYFMFDAKGGESTLRASRSGMTAIINLNCESDSDGSFLVYAAKLKQIISKAPDGDLFFEVEGSDIKVTSSKKKVRYTMKAMDSGRFPDFPNIEGKTVKGGGEWFLKGLSYVRRASANDVTREMMCSVRLEFDKEGLKMVATDGKRLHEYTVEDFFLDGTEKAAVLLPSGFVDSLCAAVKGGDLEFLVGEREFRVKTSSGLFATPYVNLQYPNYERVIPKDNPNIISFNREDLLGALERAAVINEFVILEKKGSVVSVSASNSDIGESSEDIELVKNEGQPSPDFKMKLNLGHLKDSLNQNASDLVFFNYMDGDKAFVVEQPGLDCSSEEQLKKQGCGMAVLMPMRLD